MPVADPLPDSSCEQGDVFAGLLDSLQVPKGNQTPVFVELCAGSAKLSDAVKQFGYDIIAVDHDKNRHTPRCKLVQLDLSHKHAWDMLDFLLERVVIAGVHIAPPCGTCSRARGIPMADGSKGPQPLRTTEHPLGIPSLNHRDKQRVFLANQIYKFCGEYVKKLDAAGIPWDYRKPHEFSDVGFGIFYMGCFQWIFCQHACLCVWINAEETDFLFVQPSRLSQARALLRWAT